MQVFAGEAGRGGVDVSFRNVKIKILDRKVDQWMWMTSCTGSVRRILKTVELRTRHQTRRVDFQGSQRPDEFARYGRRTRWGGRWKIQNRKNVYLSLCWRTFKLKKVIKSFIPELRSHKFFLFQDSYVLCIYVMNILCTFRIFMYDYVTMLRNFF